MISRREFISLATKAASITGGAGMVLSDPIWKAFLLGKDSGAAFARNPVDDIIASAPVARYWTSVAAAKADCSACHDHPEHLKGKLIAIRRISSNVFCVPTDASSKAASGASAAPASTSKGNCAVSSTAVPYPPMSIQ